MGRKFNSGDYIRMTKDIPVAIRNKGIKPGMFGRVTKVTYDDISEHTMYTVAVGSRKVVVRAASIDYR